MSDSKALIKDSKLLSLILRHAPEKAGLTLEDGGWVTVNSLLVGLKKMNREISKERLDLLVEENPKKRFTYSKDHQKIRAAQGHSVKIKTDLESIRPPAILFHGTATRFLDAIKSQGLKPMSRQHVHLSADAVTATKVGQRHGKPTILAITALQAHNDGYTFYQAENGVWLTDKVPTKYIDWETK